MKKIKMKKQVKNLGFIVFVVVLFLSIGIFSYVKISNQKAYEKTYEYKLLQIGYTKGEVNTLLKEYKDTELEFILDNEINKNYIELTKDKHFIYDNFYTYLEYLNENSDTSIRGIVERVNTKTNYDYYSNTEATDISKKELMLVNKYYYLDETYSPENLVKVPQTYAWGEQGEHQVNETVYNAFLNLWNAANKEGHYLMVSSSYRTYEKQQTVYDAYKKASGTDYADSIAARPGFSEHQTGYTLDIFEKDSSKKDTFHETETYNWLKENVHKYGFILRYPKDKEDITGYAFESWHYRYVGIDAATYIYENNITFDEYYAYFVK